MHLVIAGEVDFLKLRSTESGIEQGWSPSCRRESWTDSGRLILGFTKQTVNPSGELQWSTIGFHKDQKNPQLLKTLHLQCSNSYLHLETLEVNGVFNLEISGSCNTIVCSACDLSHLTLSVTGHENRITFDTSQPALEVSVSMSGWRNFVENLWLLGAAISKVVVWNDSVLTMVVQQELNERKIKFTRDKSSSITVSLPVEGPRNVQSLYELWSLDSTLLCIETQKTRKSDPLPFLPNENPTQHTICIICMNSIPDHLVLPCRHLCFCQACCLELSSREMTSNCPICRADITSIEKVFPVMGY
jgi:Zinc finger, C3HC4 type (RING finger)